jgi:membrane protein required for colicin V production
MPLALLDWFILLVLAGGLLRGFMVGAVRQVASIAGLVAALLLSVQLMHPVGALVVSSLGLSAAVAPLAGFVVIFIGTYLLFFALSRLVEGLLETLSLSLVNRAAGGALGGVKAALLLSVLFLVLSGLQVPDPKVRQESVLYTPMARALPQTLEAAAPYLPAADRAADLFNGPPPAKPTSGGAQPGRKEDK